jgi:hypothetical protein
MEICVKNEVRVTNNLILREIRASENQKPQDREATMSLFSLARRLPTATITTTFLPWRPLIQQRSAWQEVIRRIPSEDPQKAGQMTFEDVDVSDMRIGRALRAEG